jgi:AraC-like DNA-binding protein
VFQPVGGSMLRQADCLHLAIKIERFALENHLRAILDRPLRLPLDLAPSMDVSTGQGRSWATFVHLMADELQHPDSLMYDPVVSARMCESVIAGLLLAADHPYHEELLQAAPPCRPRAVKRAVDAMEADPAYPFTTIELAHVAQVSVRALQSGFRRYTGMAPMMYLRELRLARAHDELRHTERPGVTVAEVAHRWGFMHLGRFAGSYRDRFGVAPSTTLRHGG